MFHDYRTALFQFRLPATYTCTERGIRDRGIETVAARIEREGKYRERPPLTPLLSRNGVLLRHTLERATLSGMRVVSAHIQKRVRPADTSNRKEKAYRLLTFTVSRDGEENPDTFRALNHFLESRWEYLDIKGAVGESGTPLLLIMAKTIAERGKNEVIVHDSEADAFGLVVTRAQR